MSFLPQTISVGGWRSRKKAWNFGIERHVGAVVVEQVELDVRVARAIEQRLVVDPVVGIDAGDVAHAVGVLELGRFRRDEIDQRLRDARPSRPPNRP